MSKRKVNTTPENRIPNATRNKINKPFVSAEPFYTSPFFSQYGLGALVLVFVSFALYYSCIPYGYVLDDLMVITGNEYTKKGFGGLWDILTTESFQGYFGEKKDLVQGNRYRPLSIMTFAIEIGFLGGMKPMVSHFINILLYACSGIMLMMVLSMMFRKWEQKKWWFSIPFVAALIFMVHPIHTEAVANIKGRDEIMSMLFSLIALYSSMRYVDQLEKKWLLATITSYVLGLLSKENAITFLAVIPLTLYYFGPVSLGRIWRVMIWMLVSTLFYLILRFNTAGVPDFSVEITDIMNNPFFGMTAAEKMGSIMYTLGKYLQLLVWPHPLSHDYYPYAIPKTAIWTLIPLISLAVHGALLYIGIKGHAKKSVYSYAIFFYFITLSIVSNVVINVGTFMNERFIFMASAAICIAAAYFIVEKLPTLTPIGKNLALALVLVVTIGLGAKTFVRVPVWKDALSLNEAAVAVSSNSARANSFMSTALFEKYKVTNDRASQVNLLDQVEFYGQKAVGILPDYQNANLMLVGVASERYKLDNNINKYIEKMKPIIIRRPDIPFIKEFSDYLKDRGHDDQLFPFYVEVGSELMKQTDGRKNWAVIYLMYAYDLRPSNKKINELMAHAYAISGNAKQADVFLKAAQSLK